MFPSHDTIPLLEDLKISSSKVFSVSFAYWSRKSLKFLNDYYDYISNCPGSLSFLNTRTVGFNPPAKDDLLFPSHDRGILYNLNF